MPFSTVYLSAATVGMTTLAFAIAAPASAQVHYPHKHYAHTHYAHSHYRHYARRHEGRQIVVHAQEPVAVQTPAYTTWGPVAAVGTVVGGTGQAVEGVFTGAGAVVGSFVGGVLGGTAALFGHYIDGSSIIGADGHGGPPLTEAQSEEPPLLTHPRA